MRREAPEIFELLGLPAPISGEQQPFEGQMHGGAAASSFDVASFALCPCWLAFAGERKEREASKQMSNSGAKRCEKYRGVSPT